jgi:ubiquinone/menaquinone biosynthesis C-methylase UbiE
LNLFPWYRRRDVFHTVSEVAPVLRPDDRVLDVGCGYGEVAWLLSGWHPGEICTVDIADFREIVTTSFRVYDGVHLPFDDGVFDVVLVAFVLHHLPNELKPALLEEACRVTRRQVVVLEDTPRNAVDRFLSLLHGAEYRRRIGSEAAFGFLDQKQWQALFTRCGLRVVSSKRCSRFCRSPFQPFARTSFVLERDRAPGDRGPGQ